MAKRRGYSPEKIITKLREAEVLLSQGKTVARSAKRSRSVNRPTIGSGKRMGA